jgi:hypothetical protein
MIEKHESILAISLYFGFYKQSTASISSIVTRYLTSYRPISLLPIVSKVFEKLQMTSGTLPHEWYSARVRCFATACWFHSMVTNNTLLLYSRNVHPVARVIKLQDKNLRSQQSVNVLYCSDAHTPPKLPPPPFTQHSYKHAHNEIIVLLVSD